MLPCQGTCNQHVDFEVLITAPEGYIINDTNYTVAVTWNTERLKCTFEPCTLQTPNPCLLQTNSPDASYPVHSVRIYGVLFLLFKINMDKDQQLFSKWHKFSINEIVFYTTHSNCCFNFSGFKLKSLTVTPQDENTFILNGTLSLSPNQPVALLGNKTTNEINIIDTAQQLSTGTISINNPADATFTPDGQFIYIAQPEQYTVTILNSVDYTVNTVITVGKSPISIAI